MREIAYNLVTDPAYVAQLRKKLKAGRLAPAMETLLWYYAYGKPKDTLDLTGELDLRTNDAKARLAQKLTTLMARTQPDSA